MRFLRVYAFSRDCCQNLISYGGVETIRGNKIVVPYKPDAKLTWVCCDDIGACAATVLANPHAHGSKVYPLVVDAASHEEIAELLSKVMGSSQSFKVEQVDIKDWYKCQIEHGRIEVSHTRTSTPHTALCSNCGTQRSRVSLCLFDTVCLPVGYVKHSVCLLTNRSSACTVLDAHRVPLSVCRILRVGRLYQQGQSAQSAQQAVRASAGWP